MSVLTCDTSTNPESFRAEESLASERSPRTEPVWVEVSKVISVLDSYLPHHPSSAS